MELQHPDLKFLPCLSPDLNFFLPCLGLLNPADPPMTDGCGLGTGYGSGPESSPMKIIFKKYLVTSCNQCAINPII